MRKRFTFLSFVLAFVFGSGTLSAQILYDNGPLVNRPGLGSGGADESALQGNFNMTTIGFGHQKSAGNRIADDFIIPNCSWSIDSIVFYAYQTGSPLTSTITEVNLQVWNGPPGGSGSTVIFGDTSTNRMIRTSWSGIYRVTNTTFGNTQRPIMRQVVNTSGLNLNSGTYWLDWQSAGSLTSGPWIPPITIDSVTTTGNGLQRTTAWANAVDGGSMTGQGFAFVIYGSTPAPTVNAGNSQTTCPGGGVTLNPTVSGNGPFTYAWSPATGLSATNVSNPVASPNTTTTYTVNVTDANGCIGVDSVTVVIGTISANILGNDTTICPGSSLTLDAGSGNGYLWSNGDTTQTTTVSAAGLYYVDLYQPSGCPLRDSIVISVATPVQIFEDDTTICPNATIPVNATSSGFASWNWSTGASGPTTNLGPGTHTVTASDLNGCSSTASINIGALPGVSAGFNFSASGSGVTFSFNDASLNATSWFWDFGDGNTSTQQNPSHTYANNGNYTVTLIATNQCGSDTFSQSMVVVYLEEADFQAFSLYPNPSRDLVWLELDQASQHPLQVDLLDLRGRAILQEQFPAGSQKVKLELPELVEGIYLVRIETGNRKVYHKLRIE